MITEFGKAKINLTLDILGVRPDGYHEMEMIMQTVELADKIELKKIPEGIIFKMDATEIFGGDLIPADETNLAYRAAKAFNEVAGKNFGAEISLQKKVPAAAGLAGGSSDAAAVIRGMNKLYETNFSEEKLCEIGLKVGSDVPFCIVGGTCLAKGRGEKLTKLPAMKKMFVVLVKPHGEISTGRAFKSYDAEPAKIHPPTEKIISLLNAGNYDEAFKNFSNVLQPVALKDFPIISEYEKIMTANGAKVALMSGSGPTVFALTEDEATARKIAEKIDGSDAQIFVTRIG